MASPKSHRSSQSVSTSPNSLAAPGGAPMLYQQQRRMTSPSLPPPPSALDLPEPVHENGQRARRPPSPLRNGFTFDPDGERGSEDGSDFDDDEEDTSQAWARTHSPSSSVTKLASTFAQRVGSFVNNLNSPTMLSDAELEAQAQRERDKSRREAERILTQEAEERRMMEDKVMAMLQMSSKEPPTRSQTLPAESSSPSTPQKEKEGPSWWIAAKNRLTPTKEPLTPAQQIIQEAKEKEKKEKKAAKRDRSRSKSRERTPDWPSSAEKKYADPAFLNLAIPRAPAPPSRRPVPGSPSSPTPGSSKQGNSLPASLAPSPLRSNDGHASSPSREAPPLYAQFNAQGTLDVGPTLLTIAKRFEKLEKWTVGHVRALEERMSDVERWLVEKEKEKEDEAAEREENEHHGLPEGVDLAMNEMRDEIVELQGRIGELGREMARMATAPANLSSGPSRSPGRVSSAPQQNSTIVVHSLPPVEPVASPPRRVPSATSPQRRNSMSPSFVPATASASAHTPRTRLPYPTGDYATPPESVVLSQGVFSPTNSPPSSLNSNTRTRPISIAGLPSLGANPLASSSQPSLSGLPNSVSPSTSPSNLPAPRLVRQNESTSPSSSLNAPKITPPRPSSISPTPRKRYTVALGGPIMKGSVSDSTSYPSSPGPINGDLPDEEDDYDETIGKSAAARMSIYSTTSASDASPSPSPSPRPTRATNPRSRAHTTYGSTAPIFSDTASTHSNSSLTAPLRPKARSKSIDVGLGIALPAEDGSLPPMTPTSGRFVDPLLVRKQEKQALRSAAPPTPKTAVGKRKVPVGELVAFFDKDKM